MNMLLRLCICSTGFQTVYESTEHFPQLLSRLLLGRVLCTLLTSSRFMFLSDSIVPPLTLVCFKSLQSKQGRLAIALLHIKVLQSGTNSRTTSGVLLPSLQRCSKNVSVNKNNMSFLFQGMGIGTLILLCVAVCVWGGGGRGRWWW